MVRAVWCAEVTMSFSAAAAVAAAISGLLELLLWAVFVSAAYGAHNTDSRKKAFGYAWLIPSGPFHRALNAAADTTRHHTTATLSSQPHTQPHREFPYPTARELTTRRRPQSKGPNTHERYEALNRTPHKQRQLAISFWWVELTSSSSRPIALSLGRSQPFRVVRLRSNAKPSSAKC